MQPKNPNAKPKVNFHALMLSYTLRAVGISELYCAITPLRCELRHQFCRKRLTSASLQVHIPPLNHFSLWVTDIDAAYAHLTAKVLSAHLQQFTCHSAYNIHYSAGRIGTSKN
jgi:hypothetical protein